MMERRTTRRYDLSLPLTICVPNEMKTVSLTGKTRDISSQGLYFTLDSGLKAGSELDLTMTLPAELTGGIQVFIRSIGKVVRVDKLSVYCDQPIGVAVEIKRYEIVRKETAIA